MIRFIIFLEKADRAKPYGHKEYMKHTKRGKIVHVPAKGFNTLKEATQHWTAGQHESASDHHNEQAERLAPYWKTEGTKFRRVAHQEKTKISRQHGRISQMHTRLRFQKMKKAARLSRRPKAPGAYARHALAPLTPAKKKPRGVKRAA